MLARDYYRNLEYSRQYQEDEENAICHHGIKGQQWGVRRFQNKDGSYTEAGRERYGIGKKREANVIDDEKIGSVELAAAGMIAVWAGLSTVAAVGVKSADAAHNAKVTKKISDYEKHLLTEKIDKKTGLRLKDNPDADILEDMDTVNMETGYNAYSNRLGNGLTGSISRTLASKEAQKMRDGYTQNCMLCTVAMDLKRKGYDVRSAPADDGYYTKELLKWYKGGKIEKGSATEISQRLLNEPEGSYGNLMVVWKYGGGHSLFYRIENGRAIIYDTQINKVVKSMENLNTKFIKKNLDNDRGMTTYMRTDNLQPDIDYLKKNKLIRY